MRIDEDLVQRLEASAAMAALDLVAAMKKSDPTGPAVGIKFVDGVLLATGPNGNMNRAVGVTGSELSSSDLDEIERFYLDRGLAPTIELSSWAPTATVQEIGIRSYRPTWFRAMYARPVSKPDWSVSTDIHVTRADHEDDVWPNTIALGFGLTEAASLEASDAMAKAGRDVSDSIFYATIDGEIAGVASVQVVDKVAWLGPAVTLPEFRRRGVQAALVEQRLRVAIDLRCDVAAATAHPNGPSARNLLRLGFCQTHTQLVMSLPSGVAS